MIIKWQTWIQVMDDHGVQDTWRCPFCHRGIYPLHHPKCSSEFIKHGNNMKQHETTMVCSPILGNLT